ncbi:ras GEF [Fomitiporia mediterranea MF3/22]|uniref:ras GEF n=1 Tax=Fomitiporia mediterranea (strain MF3/22) TaxID=694068 RepID=UPI0004408637|nr:ras GEF [Fomitiporia mediterranea MF3/22]EJC97980.1 ras GEF [Fomitiporia mediterranea MF3/22]
MSAAATMLYPAGDHQAANNTHEDDAQAGDDQMLSTFYCRALYDYQSTDNSSLSFYRGDIIEVLTQLESGWWDGLLGEERGWFPSNYVQPISEAEAEAELGPQEPVRVNEVHDSAIDVSQRVRGATSDHDWMQEEIDYARSRNGFQDLANGAMAGQNLSHQDYWLPEVDATGQIFYVNTQTGERSRDLPAEMGPEINDNSLGGQQPAANLRTAGRNDIHNQFSGLVNGNAIGGAPSASFRAAGFGLAKRSGTPEPWTKRLVDDGLTYYYFNKITGQIQWTRPVPENGAVINASATIPRIDTTTNVTYPNDAHQNGRQYVAGPSSTTSGYASTNETMFTEARLRADSVTSNNQSSKRDSVYSDDSDVHPREGDAHDRPVRPLNGGVAPANDPGLTPAERSAFMLQSALAPPEPESIDTLADQTRDAIIVVMASVDDNGLPKGADHDKEVEQNVGSVVVAVRNLLYVSCALAGPLPSVHGERDSGDPAATAVVQQLQAQLKSSQRKVTATLSKLVLSARAARYKREALSSEMMIRVEQDAADLQRAVDNFVSEVKKQHARTVIKQLHQRIGKKRLRGVFDLQHIGLGLPGAGVAGAWKGFGFINVDDGLGLPKRSLNEETVTEVKNMQETLDGKLAALVELVQDAGTTSDELLNHTQALLADISAFVSVVIDVNICQDVDVGGLRGDQASPQSEDPYMRAVAEARSLLRKFEAITQSLFDDGAILFAFVQTIPFKWPTTGNVTDTIDRQGPISSLYGSAKVLMTGTKMAVEFLEKLLAIAREQIASEGRFRESVALRISRMSIMDGNRRLSHFFGPMPDAGNDDEDIVDMGFAFQKSAARPAMTGVDAFVPETAESASSPPPRQETLSVSDKASGHKKSLSISKDLPLDPDLLGLEDEDVVEKKPRGTKIRQILGDDAPERWIENANADSKPWYLRADHKKEEIMFTPDGGIRAGTLPALIERLTTHEYGDAVFIRTFLMTYKSFTTLDELFDLLVQRYWIQPPDGLKPNDLEEWTKLKQHIIRSRVLNTFKTMVTDDQVLVEDDMYILDRIKEFLLHPEVSVSPASKTLLNIIERKKQGGIKPLALTPPTSFPPPPIIPKGMNKGKLKLLDIDPLELARQLTIMEFALYRTIKAIECLQRSREQKVGEHKDHITDVIQMTNKIANWVNATVLSKEDSRKRAALVKQFIGVADRCRNLHNFSSMAAIISGLNSPPIRRLKRTWEQVSGRFMSQLGSCEMTLDSTKNFTNYKATLAQTNPPGIPFIGVYLTTLTFINDGSKDILPGNLINFGKRQRAAEIIREIQRWQSKDFNLAPLTPILTFIEESLSAFNESVDWGEHFWNLSLEREPREREDEKMARLLQESGFL